MQRSIQATIDAPPERVYDTLASLEAYPSWLDLVSRVEPAEPVTGDPDAAWWVTLRAKVGPFARSKRLRMVRVIAHRATGLRFERSEIDGRDHANWTLDVGIDGDLLKTNVAVMLAYEGGLWTTPLEAVLGRQLTEAIPRLRELLA